MEHRMDQTYNKWSQHTKKTHKIEQKLSKKKILCVKQDKQDQMIQQVLAVFSNGNI